MKLKEKMLELGRAKQELLNKKTSFIRYVSNVCFAVGIVSLFSMPLIGATMVGLGASLMATEENRKDKIKSKVDAITTEEKNLSKMSYTGVDTSPTAKLLRDRKIESLCQKRDQQEAKATGSKVINGLLDIGVVVSACAAIATPGVLSFVTPAVALVKLIQNKGLYNNIKALDVTNAQINSLNNEKQFAHEYPLRKRQVKQNTNNKENSQAKQRVVVKTSRMPEQTATRRPVQTRVVPDYYNSIYYTGQAKENSVGGYQKVKR